MMPTEYLIAQLEIEILLFEQNSNITLDVKAQNIKDRREAIDKLNFSLNNKQLTKNVDITLDSRPEDNTGIGSEIPLLILPTTHKKTSSGRGNSYSNYNSTQNKWQQPIPTTTLPSNEKLNQPQFLLQKKLPILTKHEVEMLTLIREYQGQITKRKDDIYLQNLIFKCQNENLALKKADGEYGYLQSLITKYKGNKTNPFQKNLDLAIIHSGLTRLLDKLENSTDLIPTTTLPSKEKLTQLQLIDKYLISARKTLKHRCEVLFEEREKLEKTLTANQDQLRNSIARIWELADNVICYLPFAEEIVNEITRNNKIYGSTLQKKHNCNYKILTADQTIVVYGQLVQHLYKPLDEIALQNIDTPQTVDDSDSVIDVNALKNEEPSITKISKADLLAHLQYNVDRAKLDIDEQEKSNLQSCQTNFLKKTQQLKIQEGVVAVSQAQLQLLKNTSNYNKCADNFLGALIKLHEYTIEYKIAQQRFKWIKNNYNDQRQHLTMIAGIIEMGRKYISTTESTKTNDSTEEQEKTNAWRP